jgi:hypothetical protein
MWPRPAVGYPPELKECAGMDVDFGALSWHYVRDSIIPEGIGEGYGAL